MNKTTLSKAVMVVLSLAHPIISHAGSATWDLDPTDSKWGNELNWTPQTVPKTFRDTATFDASNVTTVRMTDFFTSIDAAVFNQGANAFTVIADGDNRLTFRGDGIVNNSGVTQTFEISPGYGDAMTFFNHSTIGKDVVINMRNLNLTLGAALSFWQHSSAGYVTVNVPGALTPNGTYQARVFFFHGARGGNAHFIMEGGQIGNGEGGTTEFDCDYGCSAEK
jgi:hypothetical protein